MSTSNAPPTLAAAVIARTGKPLNPANMESPPAPPHAPLAVVQSPSKSPPFIRDTQSTFCAWDLDQNNWRAVAPPESRPEDFLNPEAWVYVEHEIKLCDNVRVIAQDASWMADLIVIGRGPGPIVRMHLVQVIELGGQADESEEIPPGYDVRKTPMGSTQPGWVAVRLSDDHVMNSGNTLLTRLDAVKFLLEHPVIRANPLQRAR